MKRKYSIYVVKRRTRLNKTSHASIIIPKTSHDMYRPRYTIYDLKWDFHECDDDFFPSVPHGHSGEYKLDIVDGIVYDRNNENIGNITKKELKKIQNDQKFIQFAREAKKWYQSKYPERDIKTPNWIDKPASKASLFRYSYVTRGYRNKYSVVLQTEIIH